MKQRHFQWDGKRLPGSAWIGADKGFVLGLKLALNLPEELTSCRGRYLSIWLGPLYAGIEVDR